MRGNIVVKINYTVEKKSYIVNQKSYLVKKINQNFQQNIHNMGYIVDKMNNAAEKT